jgi:ferredoxin
MDAVVLVDAVATVDLGRCIGCGVCVPTCPESALSLVNKAYEMVPPETAEDRLDMILAGKATQAQAL